MKKTLLLLCLALVSLPVSAKHYHLEKDYQNAWCKAHSGVTEVKNPDLSRVDCLTDEFAIEFDFANKWAESIGQALYYALVNNKRAGVVLISENGDNDIRYIERLKRVAKAYNICIWVITPSYLDETQNLLPPIRQY